MNLVLFLLVLFLANVIQAITGFAGTVLAMPPSMYLLGMENAKVILNVCALISGFLIAATNAKHIQWKELARMVLFMLAGMVVGIHICEVVQSEDILLNVYGMVILIIAGKNLLIRKEITLPKIALWIILLLAGIIHGMFVSGGALLVIYAVQVLKNKDEFRATVAPVWVVLNSFLLVSQMRQGLFTERNVTLITVSIIPLFVATWLGGKLAKRVSQKVFLNLTYILLIISGISLIL